MAHANPSAPGLQSLGQAIATLLGSHYAKRSYWASARWSHVPTTNDPTNRHNHPWTTHDYEVLVAWLRKTAFPEDVGRSRAAFVTHTTHLLDHAPDDPDAWLDVAREAVSAPDYQFPQALLDRLANVEIARDPTDWEDGELEWSLRALAGGSSLEFVASILQRSPHTIAQRWTHEVPGLFTSDQLSDEQVTELLRSVLASLSAPRRYIAPSPQPDAEPLVPRRNQPTTRTHRESLALLSCSGWGDQDITRLLGEPDGISPHTDPGYSTERVLLATLSDQQLRGRLHPAERSHTVRRALEIAAQTQQGPVGLWVRLAGYGWLLVCRAADASAGAIVTACRPDGSAHAPARLLEPFTWGDYAVAAAQPASHQPASQTATSTQ